MGKELDDYELIEMCDAVIERHMDEPDGRILCETAFRVRAAALERIEGDRRLGPMAITLLLAIVAVALFLIVRAVVAALL